MCLIHKIDKAKEDRVLPNEGTAKWLTPVWNYMMHYGMQLFIHKLNLR